MTSTKPYRIAKRTVWEAYQQVKANRGAAGIDEETIAMFEQNLSKNLYKLWNRMSSGSYFPPPVKQVEIPKAKGGFRKLGIPTVSDRIAQTVVKLNIEPILDPLTVNSLAVATASQLSIARGVGRIATCWLPSKFVRSLGAIRLHPVPLVPGSPHRFTELHQIPLPCRVHSIRAPDATARPGSPPPE